MQSVIAKTIRSGLAPLDELLQGLHLADNVVWQVDHLEDRHSGLGDRYSTDSLVSHVGASRRLRTYE